MKETKFHICKSWRSKTWEVSFRHVFREQNQVTNRLAKTAAFNTISWRNLDWPPADIRDRLHNDEFNVPSVRNVSREC